jgi:predicted nucleic-acid-binding protein
VIGLDSNVLIRYLVADDAAQHAAAARLIDSGGSGGLFLATPVLVETCWTLARSYRIGRPEIAAALAAFADRPDVEVQHGAEVRAALRDAAAGADFADALIARLGARAGCESTVTFDRGVTGIPGMRRLGQADPRPIVADS